MFEKLKALLVEELQIDEADITLDAKLSTDLGINSIELADLVMLCEEKFDIVIEDADIHDFRTVVGHTHTNLIFDVAVPFEVNESTEKIIEKISSAVSEKRSDCYCVITVDRS